MAAKKSIQFLNTAGKWRGMGIVIVGMSEKYSDKVSAKSQSICRCLDIIHSAHWGNGAEARMFKNPVEWLLERLASQKITNDILFIPLASQRMGVANGRWGKIDPDNLRGVAARNRANIVTRAASRHKHPAGHRVFLQPIYKRRMWCAFVPRRVPRNIAGLPINACASVFQAICHIEIFGRVHE